VFEQTNVGGDKIVAQLHFRRRQIPL
jgi:hypothetical protein